MLQKGGIKGLRKAPSKLNVGKENFKKGPNAFSRASISYADHNENVDSPATALRKTNPTEGGHRYAESEIDGNTLRWHSRWRF